MLTIRVPNRGLRSLLLVISTIATLALTAGEARAQSCGPCEKLVRNEACPEPDDDVAEPVCERNKCVPDAEKEGQRCRGNAGDACKPAAYCRANGMCPVAASVNSDTVCRPSTGSCDVAETCEQQFGLFEYKCPADEVKRTGVTCRASVGSCDVAETCDGSSAQCPADRVVSAGTECRAGAGACDVAETCNGTSGFCPTNTLKPAGAVCRSSDGLCDVAETCSGTSATCPLDAVQTAGSVCRPAAGVCDATETCDGTSQACTVDKFKTPAIVCRGRVGVCDVAEACSGTSIDCPTDKFKASDEICNDSRGQCDPGELCTGSTAECPANVIYAAGTPCQADSNECTVDACDAGGRCTHVVTDGDDDGTCDGKDPCTNVAGERTFVTSPKSKTAFAKVGTQAKPNDDVLTLRASFDLPAAQSFAALAPDTSGARLLVSSLNGDEIVDVTLASGTYAGRGTRGWSRSRSGKVWTFVDRTGVPKNGIVKVKISDKAGKKTPDRANVVVTGKNGSYPVLASDAPLAVVVALGDQADAAAGLCGESSYATEDCTANRAGDRITCTR